MPHASDCTKMCVHSTESWQRLASTHNTPFLGSAYNRILGDGISLLYFADFVDVCGSHGAAEKRGNGHSCCDKAHVVYRASDGNSGGATVGYEDPSQDVESFKATSGAYQGRSWGEMTLGRDCSRADAMRRRNFQFT